MAATKRGTKKAAVEKKPADRVTLKDARLAAKIVRQQKPGKKAATWKKGGPAWERVLGSFGVHSR